MKLRQGITQDLKLPVSAPFHCDLIALAADAMATALADVAFADAALPVFCNVSAAGEQVADALKGNLITQVTGRVRWRESLMALDAAGAVILSRLALGRCCPVWSSVRSATRPSSVRQPR